MTRIAGLVCKVKTRVGRRGYSLLVLALIDFVYGSSLVWASPETRAIAQYAYADSLLPLRIWGAAWLAVGLLCLMQAGARRDQAAFAAAIAIKVAWGVLSLLGWVAGELPRGYLSAAIWLVFASLVAVIASWPEPSPRTRTSPDALISANAKGMIIHWNTAATRMFGWSASEIIGRPLATVVPPEVRDRHEQGFARAALERRSDLVGQVLQLRGLRRDGRRFPLELTISVWNAGDDGGEVTFTGLVRDVSRQQSRAVQ